MPFRCRPWLQIPGRNPYCPEEYSPGQRFHQGGCAYGPAVQPMAVAAATAQEVQNNAREYSRARVPRETSCPKLAHFVRSCLGGSGNNKTAFARMGDMPFRPWGSSPHAWTHNAPTTAAPIDTSAIYPRLSSGATHASPSPAPTRRNAFPGWLLPCTGRSSIC